MTEDKNKPKPMGGLVLSSLLPAMANLTKKSALLKVETEAAAVASTGSVAVSGDNHGSIVNLNVTTQSLTIERQIARELPSYLSKVVARFSEDLSEYNSGPMRSLPPEVDVKLAYNDFPPSHHIITDYAKYLCVLEATYRGIEQRNDDARRLVRRRAARAYGDQLHKLCAAHGIKHQQAHDFARQHAVYLVSAVVEVLMTDVAAGGTAQVMHETADLAVCLIVADAVIECEVLERPAHAATS